MTLTEAMLSESWVVDKWPQSKCRNCKGEIRLFKGRWHHIEMHGGSYHQAFNSGCERPWPLRCAGCQKKLDYKTLDIGYYDYKCNDCIEKEKQGDKIGLLTAEMKKKLREGKGDHLKYGTMVAAVITKNGIWFVDIC
jgi:hypothetical protein